MIMVFHLYFQKVDGAQFLSLEKRISDPVFGPWLALARVELPDLSSANPLVAEVLGDGPASLPEVAGRYQDLLRRSINEEKENAAAAWQELRKIVEGPESPIRIPREYIHDVEWLFDDENKRPLKKAQAALDLEIINLREKAPHALILIDRPVAGNVFTASRKRMFRTRSSSCLLSGCERYWSECVCV